MLSLNLRWGVGGGGGCGACCGTGVVGDVYYFNIYQNI